MFKWRSTTRKRRQTAVLGALALILIILLTAQQHSNREAVPGYYRLSSESTSSPLGLRSAQFWKILHQLILNNDPHCKKKPDLVVPRNPRIAYDPEHAHSRPDVLWMDGADVSRMKSAHANFVKDIRSLPTSLVLLTVLAISLGMLRKTQCTLPVEVFLDRPSPRTDEFCAKVFPSLNADCRYFSDIFAEADTNVKLNTYQYKIFSILFSSFEDVLLLDSDAWPVTNPEPLFHSLPFTDSGLVLWPDFWYASESPYFFHIAKISSPPTLDARPATESGEILYSKSKHCLSIMLATYYNFYGPEYYYLLQSQGGPGQGDKETFAWAATALNEEFYFVKQPVRSFGRHDSSGEYIGTAMIQFDPVNDFFHNARLPVTLKDPNEVAHPGPVTVASPPKPLFIHANYPKFDPYTIFDDSISAVQTPTRDTNGKLVRCWMPKADALETFGVDIEKSFWETIQETTCVSFAKLWQDGSRPEKHVLEQLRKRNTQVCEKVKSHYTEVFGNDLNKS
ncbi:mannosyltransferase [Lithohypha guttulata]|uniref:mannosyltransferase n=1 Tax=Lithohypha guttulata TaxID=1690604 RepID=UPI00315D379A